MSIGTKSSNALQGPMPYSALISIARTGKVSFTHMNRLWSSWILAGGLLCCQAASAETFLAPNFKQGDAWIYRFTMHRPGESSSSFLQEQTILWKAADGRWVPGGRRADEQRSVAQPEAPIPEGRCLVASGPPRELIDAEFCNKEVAPGTHIARMQKGFTSDTSFEGVEQMSTQAGNFRAAKFRVEERFLSFRDDSAPNARRRVWEYWYAPDARGMVKMRLTYFDAEDAVQRTVSADLTELKLR